MLATQFLVGNIKMPYGWKVTWIKPGEWDKLKNTVHEFNKTSRTYKIKMTNKRWNISVKTPKREKRDKAQTLVRKLKNLNIRLKY